MIYNTPYNNSYQTIIIKNNFYVKLNIYYKINDIIEYKTYTKESIMSKFIYLTFIVLIFTSCASPKYNSVSKYIDFAKEKRQFTNASCTSNSYISNVFNKEYGNIFIEKINLNSNCEWNGFQRSFFDNLFKEKNHIKTMIALERMDFNNYELSTYLINDKYIMNLISEFSGNESIFIVDYQGALFNKMIKAFDANYINSYLGKSRFFSNYKSSLVNENIIKNYFSQEIERP
jgi:hypothetical protein